MLINILIFVVVAAILYALLKKPKKNIELSNSVIFEKTVVFDLINSNVSQINLGSKINIWCDNRNGKVSACLKGTDAYNDVIATTDNSEIQKIYNSNSYFEESTEILRITENTILIKIVINKISDAEIEKRNNQYFNEWEQKLLRKYNPVKNWELRFYHSEKMLPFDSKTVVIKTIGKNNVKEYHNNLNDAIWLENHEGKRIIIEHNSRNEDLIKTLRAVYSGHILEIKSINTTGYYLNLEIGTKN
ncbi:MAG: hypothetical protein RSF68_07895 [Myroides sp.]